MLDPRLIRETPHKIEEMLKARSVDFNLDALARSDAERRRLIIRTDQLRQKRNKTGQAIAELKKKGEDASDALAEMKVVSGEIAVLE